MTEKADRSLNAPIQRIDFTTFILSISSAAFMGLGISDTGESKTQGESGPLDLELARQNIDLLELMSEKTRGNLSADEGQLLEQLLFQTRMHFIDAARTIQVGGQK